MGDDDDQKWIDNILFIEMTKGSQDDIDIDTKNKMALEQKINDTEQKINDMEQKLSANLYALNVILRHYSSSPQNVYIGKDEGWWIHQNADLYWDLEANNI